ncbi:MAG: serine hydrolase [Kiritimatiellae bacterium]|nr:serine hydrolase [Kiritimatiellia bacterium]
MKTKFFTTATLSSFLACGFMISAKAAEMEYATPESQGVSSRAVLKWINACEKSFAAWNGSGALHGFVIVRNGKTIAEGSWKPFNTLEETHMLYSHSKSFTSTAIGFLVEEGNLDLDERVMEIFPELTPTNVTDNLKSMRVRDLLTMNVGAKWDHKVHRFDDWGRTFMEKELQTKPGCGFKYDSDATYMLAAIVEKRSGEKLMDYLDKRFFKKIGIEKAWSTVSPQDIACGGWGMNMTTREMARFGLCYAQNGVWGGKNVIHPQWVQLATARHTFSGWRNVGIRALGEGSDWQQGYGFQFWRCHNNGYRADGAAGQLTLVYPDVNLVVSVNAGLGDMQKEINLVRDYILEELKDGALPENPEAYAELKKRLAGLEIAPVKGDIKGVEKFLGKEIEAAKNSRGIKIVKLYRKEGTGELRLVFKVKNELSDIPVGVGRWTEGVIRIDNQKAETLGAIIGEQKAMTSGAMQEDGSFKLRIYLTGTTAYIDVILAEKDEKIVLKGELWGMNGTRFGN